MKLPSLSLGPLSGRAKRRPPLPSELALVCAKVADFPEQEILHGKDLTLACRHPMGTSDVKLNCIGNSMEDGD